MNSDSSDTLIKKGIEAKLLLGSFAYIFWGGVKFIINMPFGVGNWERFVISALGIILYLFIRFNKFALSEIIKIYDFFIMIVVTHIFALFWRSPHLITYQIGLILLVSVVCMIRNSSPYFKLMALGIAALSLPTFWVLPVEGALYISLNLITILSLGLLEGAQWKNFMKAYIDKNNRLETIYNATFEGILIFREDGVILENNAALANIFAYEVNFLKNKTLNKIFLQSDIETIKALYSRQSPNTALKLTAIKANAAELYCEVNVKQITIEKEKYGMLLVRDITDQVRSENLLKDQQNKLAQSSKFSILGEMAAGIGHEINNPLAVIQGWAEEMQVALKDEKVSSREILKEGLDKILLTTQRISKIIRGLKSLAHQGNQEPFIPYDIRQIVEDALVLCQDKFKENQIQFSLDIKTENLIFDCRPHEISQVLLNFIGNSIDAVKVLQERWIKIQVTDNSEMLEISIIDSGKGIPAAIKDKIMQPFFTTKTLGKGTGLGLSISKSLVESHHGALWIQSASINTKFVVLLPRSQTA